MKKAQEIMVKKHHQYVSPELIKFVGTGAENLLFFGRIALTLYLVELAGSKSLFI